MAIKTLFFKQFDYQVDPSSSEVFAETVGHFINQEVKLYIIGSSHHLTIGDVYTERLACEENISAALNDRLETFSIDTQIGVFETKIWQEKFLPKDFLEQEQNQLQQKWDLKYCFRPNTAFTGIQLSDNKITTIHSYPEYGSLIYSITRLLT